MYPQTRNVAGRAHRAALIEFVEQHGGLVYIVLNFNRPVTRAAAQQQAGRLFARLDRHYLGHGWARKTDERGHFLCIMEHVSTNLHINLVGDPPMPAQMLPISALSACINRHWQQIVPGGAAHLQRIYDLSGLAHYCTKELLHPETTDQVFHSRDFWPA